MDSSYSSVDDSYSSIHYYSRSQNNSKVLDISISDQLAGFEKLKISALTRAAKISPQVKEVTIGPRSPLKKEIILDNIVPEKPEEVVNLLEDKLGGDLRYKLLFKATEAQLRQRYEDIFKNSIENMIEKHAEFMRRHCKKQSDDYEKKTQEMKEKRLKMILCLRESDNMSVLQGAKLDEQKCQQINQQAIDNMNKILEEQNKAAKRFASITDSHTKICICFNNINGLIQTDELAKEISLSYMPSVNSILHDMSAIMDNCKTREITENDVKQSEQFAVNLENIKQKIINDLKEAKNEALRKQQEEELRNKQIEQEKANLIQQEKDIENQKRLIGPLFYSENSYNYYMELQKFLSEYEDKFKQLLEDNSLKKFKFDCQKAVNTPVNTLSSVSGTHMRSTLEKLTKLLRGEKVQVSDAYVCASQHPQGLYYCTALLAKKIVRQGDLLVSSNPEAAFPLAAVTIVLWIEFPEFGKLLEAYFHKMCPYLVPMFLPQKQGQSDKDFYLSRGYTYNDKGEVEKQDKFLKRMSGIFRLRCAIWIAKTPSFISAPNPHGLRYGWQWLAAFINLKPEPDICATLLYDFFNICGSEFFKHYKMQFRKIIKLISTSYLEILQNIDEGGPKTRLEVFLQDVLQSGTISPPKGLLPRNTW